MATQIDIDAANDKIAAGADGAVSLGDTTNRFANVYTDNIGDTGQDLNVLATTTNLPSGHVFDYASGAETITHSANTITVGGVTTWATSATTHSFDGAVTIDTSGNNALTLDAGTAGIITGSGSVFINETVNANMTTGLTINQGAADNTIIALKSSDVAHPMTAVAETDTFGSFTKGAGGPAGGLQIEGLSDANATTGGRTLILVASAGDVTLDVTHTAGTVGAMDFYVRKSDGSTGVAALANDEAAFTWSNNGHTRLLLQGEGEMHVTNTTLVALDDYDDNQLLRAGELETNSAGVIRSRWDDAIPYNIDTLKDLGVLSEDGNFWSLQKRMSLNANASWQNHCSIRALQEDMSALHSELVEAKTKIERLVHHA